MQYFQQRLNKEFSAIKYDVLVCHYCRMMMTQHANLLSLVHIPKHYNFNLSFARLYVVLFHSIVQMMVVVAINTASVVAVLPYSYHMQVLNYYY